MIKHILVNWVNDDLPLQVVSTNLLEKIVIHTHDFMELVFFVNGSATHMLFNGDQKSCYSVMQGDCFAILPQEAHAFEDGKQVSFYNVIFSPSFISDELEELKKFDTWKLIFGSRNICERNKIHLSLNSRIILNEYIQELLIELQDMPEGYKLSAKALLIKILLIILRSKPQKMTQSSRSSKINPFILNVITEMEKNPEKCYILNDLAKKANMSISNFSRKFQDISGTSPIEYLISLRMGKAESLLLSTDMSIYDIAEQCGFHDVNYFIKTFRRYRNTTPAKFRKNN